MTSPLHYEAPYHWWGPGPAPPRSLSLQDLVRNGTIDVEQAAMLCAALAQHRSLTVIGGPSGLGKSTLLHALITSMPRAIRRVYLRGCYETFAFQHDSDLDPASTALLVNEISPHLPIYLWGPAVKRALAAGAHGYQVLATAHGRSVVEFLASLTGSPLRIPARTLAAIDLVALLEPTPDGTGRRVTELWQLSAARDGVSIDQILPGDLPSGVTTGDVAAARDAVLSLLGQDHDKSGTPASGGLGAENGETTPTRSGSSLEQTSVGE
jgi:energy-coupling factor transporter ATP-binding protein EcfA2